MGIAIGSGIALLVGGVVVGLVSGGETYTLPLLGEVRAWQLVFIITGAPGTGPPSAAAQCATNRSRGLIRMNVASGARAKYSVPAGHCLHGEERPLLQSPLFRNGDDGDARLRRRLLVAGSHGAHVRNSGVRVGKVLGLSVMFINTFGIFVAGRLCDRLTQRGLRDAPIWVCFGTAVLVVVTSALPAFMPTATLGLIAMCVAGFPFHGYVAMGPMAVNQVTPNQMRGQVSAVYLFVVNLIGQGVGPWAVGAISDHVLKDPSQIRYALLTVVLGAGVTAALLCWFARRPYRVRLEAAAQWQ